MKEIPKNIGMFLLTVERKTELTQTAHMIYQVLTTPTPIHKRNIAIGDTWLQKIIQRLSNSRITSTKE